jgi:hypothetical protein
MLVKQPAFSVAAALVLALGIGGSTAMFSLVNAFLLKPLLIRDPQQIVGCFNRDTQKSDSYRAFSYPNYADLRDQNTVFSSVMAHNLAMVGITEGDTTRRAFADVISSNYFFTLGVPLFRGREFTPAEEQPGSAVPSAIISYTYWRKSGADPDILGKTRQINGRIYTVVGITPKGFTGTIAMLSPELYLPLGMHEAVENDFEGRGRPLALRDNNALIVVGRMKDGTSLQAANTSLSLVADRLAKAYPGENKDYTILAHQLSRNSITTNPSNSDEIALPAILLTAMAAIVLLIASLNVANMMLARSAARREARQHSAAASRGGTDSLVPRRTRWPRSRRGRHHAPDQLARPPRSGRPCLYRDSRFARPPCHRRFLHSQRPGFQLGSRSQFAEDQHHHHVEGRRAFR